MSTNANLRKADKNKDDEYYTLSTDIELELNHQEYAPQFRDKVVYLNCDSPESEFWKFFMHKFNLWGIKKLIATHYETTGQRAHKWERVSNATTKIPLFDNGDFASTECIEILRTADIVVTNPPFSLFRKYINLLMQFNKKFLIIGSINAITYKEVFPLLKNNEVWIGYTHPKKFLRAGGEIKELRNIAWYTNIPIRKRQLPLTLSGEKELEKFDNYNILNCNKVKDIPKNYYEPIAVPITYMEKHCPEQFEILDAIGRYAILDYFSKNKEIRQRKSHSCNINGKSTYFRIIIKRLG